MNPNTLIITEAGSYLLVYSLVHYVARHYQPQGDAAGSGMAKGFLLLYVIALFFLIAVVLTVINFYILKQVTDSRVRFLAFLPILTSIALGGYTFFFG
jgi:hypothetical protein